MKMTSKGLLATVGVILAGTALGAFRSDDFESYTNNTPLLNTNQWNASSASVVVQSSKKHWGSMAAVLPVSSSVSNVVNTGTNKVWSDFYTVPRVYVSDTSAGPAADTNATAQFYVTSNGQWAVICRSGSAIVTNVIATNVYNAAVPTYQENLSNFVHVSVLHDYTAGKWSLFVDDVPIATNLGFINQAVTTYTWFNMQNGGGDSAWLDDFAVSNRVPATLTADTDHDGLIDAWEIMYFGSINATDSSSANTDGDVYTYGEESSLGLSPSEFDAANLGPLAATLPFSDYFESPAAPLSLYGLNGWDAGPTSTVSLSTGGFHGSTQDVRIIAGHASHAFLPNQAATNVWTHLVLKPVQVNESQGAPGSVSTVSFFVDSNGVVNAYSGGGYTYLTNIVSAPGGTNAGSFSVEPNAWYRFITKSDYVTRKWSLYAVKADSATTYARLIGDGLDFNSAASAQTAYQGLFVTNLADNTVTGYLDNVEITLSMSPWIDTDGDGIPDYFEQDSGMSATSDTGNDENNNGRDDRLDFAWGTTSSVFISSADLANPTGRTVALTVENLPINQDVGVLAQTGTPNGAIASLLATFNTGPRGTNTFLDTNGVPVGGRKFYQFMSMSGDGSVSATNWMTYVVYSQSRQTTGIYYWVTVPVDYGTNNRLDGLLGRHLARGLYGDSDDTVADSIQLPDDSGVFHEYYLNGSGSWVDKITDNAATQSLVIGQAVLVARRSGAANRPDTVLAGLQQTNQISVQLHSGWNMVGWAYDNTSTDWGFTNGTYGTVTTNADFIYLLRNNATTFVPVRNTPTNIWRVGYTLSSQPITNTAYLPLAVGEGLLYRRVGAPIYWTPNRP